VVEEARCTMVEKAYRTVVESPQEEVS
jgi:hypothetical protein